MANHWFPKLRKLGLSLEDFDSAALIMDLIHHLPFPGSLTFDLKRPRPHSPSKLLQSLGSNPHLPLSLSTLIILDDMQHSLVHDASNAETPSMFQPLLALTNLQTLILRLSGVEMLDDAWLNLASKSFPRLQVLTLHGRALERKQITLAGYVPLVQNSPKSA